MNLIPDSSLTVSPAAQLIVNAYAKQYLARLGLQNIKFCTYYPRDENCLTFFNMASGSWLEAAADPELWQLGLVEDANKRLMTMDEANELAAKSFEAAQAMDAEANNLDDMFHF